MSSKEVASRKRSQRDELVLRVFLIEGDGRIQDVGARPKLYVLANKNGVQIFPRNLRGNKIEVIVKGEEKSIKRFWRCVKKADLIQTEKNPGVSVPYEVGEIKDYLGEEPDFGYFASASTMEQVSKGTKYLMRLERIDDTLVGIDSKLNKLPKEIAMAMRKSKKD